MASDRRDVPRGARGRGCEAGVWRESCTFGISASTGADYHQRTKSSADETEPAVLMHTPPRYDCGSSRHFHRASLADSALALRHCLVGVAWIAHFEAAARAAR